MDRLGVLNVTGQGVLVLFNSTNYAIWSSNVSRIAQNPVVKLLDSGNLAVKDGNDSNPDNFLCAFQTALVWPMQIQILE